MLSAQQVLDEATLALRSALRPELGGVPFVNRVGRAFIRITTWSYLDGATAQVAVADGSDTVELPVQLDRLDEVSYLEQRAPYQPVRWTRDWAEFERWQRWGSGYVSGYRYLAALRQEAQASGLVGPVLKLSPVATQDDTWQIRYRAGWAPVGDLGETIVVPTDLEEVVLATSRAMARALETQPESMAEDPMGAAMASLRRNPDVVTAILRDANRLPAQPPPMGPVGKILRSRTRGRYGPRSVDEINLP